VIEIGPNLAHVIAALIATVGLVGLLLVFLFEQDVIHPCLGWKVWEKAAQLLPFHFKLTVSQFCSAAIREVVSDWRKASFGCPECSGVQIEEKPSERMMCRTSDTRCDRMEPK
jgi:predicted RNA-binding Zn-ribbon protein involved in translation (DUF1610 family)